MSVYCRSSKLEWNRIPGGEWAARSPEVKVCIKGQGVSALNRETRRREGFLGNVCVTPESLFPETEIRKASQ